MMRFSTKRGRPKCNKPAVDLGTKELQKKRQNNYTKETLDLLSDNELITKKQHKAGIKLRWLHSIRFGIQRITSQVFEDYGVEFKPHHYNLKWRASRELEYETAIKQLKRINSKKLIIDICVFNYRPAYLLNQDLIGDSIIIIEKELEYIKDGLDAIL